jgi:hypothetical protein
MPVVKEVKGTNGEVLGSLPELTEEDKFALEEKKKFQDALLESECIAKYKIELMFAHDRSLTKPSAGMISIWESGAKLHGGGDSKSYLCPGKSKGVNDCEALISGDSCNFGHLVCAKCGKVWKSNEADGELQGRHTMQDWAKKLEKVFFSLGCNADIYIKQPKYDIRAVAKREQEENLGGALLEKARREVYKVNYTLNKIIADTSNGSSHYDRFYALLKT